MLPINLNEFLLRHPVILALRLQVDEAAVEVKYAHVASLRALSEKNATLIARWHEYFRQCEHGHEMFLGAFYKQITALLNIGPARARGANKEMLRRKIRLDECMIDIGNAEEACIRAFAERNVPLLARWHEQFGICRARYLSRLTAFRRDFLRLPPSVM
jgi:hypothetical protein